MRAALRQHQSQRRARARGGYHIVGGDLRVRQVRVDDGTDRDRFVICHNPERARSPTARCASRSSPAWPSITGADRLTQAKLSELYGAISTKPAFKRFLRRTPTGKLRIDRSAVAHEAKLDRPRLGQART